MGRNKYANEENSYKRMNILGYRLMKLRQERNWTQADMAQKISIFLANEPLSNLSISAYENGRRLPSIQVLIAMAQLFEVSVDYLVGHDVVTTDRADKLNTQTVYPQIDTKIRVQEYENFDGLPVYVKGKDVLVAERWGILDYPGKRVVFPDGELEINKSVELYRGTMLEFPAPFTDLKPLNLGKMLGAKMVFIVPRTSDPVAKEKYRGHYKHNEDHSCLINVQNGLLLPYTGLNISYIAYPVHNL